MSCLFNSYHSGKILYKYITFLEFYKYINLENTFIQPFNH